MARNRIRTGRERYEIIHASGRLTVVSATLWAEHVQIGNLIRLARRRAMVARHLACCEIDGRLVFQERNEDGFSGDQPISSQWAAVMRAWLLKGPFAELIDLDHCMREGRTRPDAYVQALDRAAV
jgi:hypothetical protein